MTVFETELASEPPPGGGHTQAAEVARTRNAGGRRLPPALGIHGPETILISRTLKAAAIGTSIFRWTNKIYQS